MSGDRFTEELREFLDAHPPPAARGFDAEHTLRLIQDEACTVILGVPTLFQVWQNHPAFAGADFGRVRFFINGGELTRAGSMQDALDLLLHQHRAS